jgi:hypothetical protein
MIRALTTLVGLACAAALLLLVNDTGSAEGGGLWKRAALLAGAGIVAGAFYQIGGIRRPGVRLNIPLFIGAFLPWTLLALALCSNRSGTPVWLNDLTHDILPDSALTRWSPSFPILAFTDGLLFAFALLEPVVQQAPQVRIISPVAAATPVAPEAESEPEAEAETETVRSQRPVSLVGQPDEE